MNRRLFRGLGLKLVGLCSKAAFVLIFASDLLSGEFAIYFVFSIYALIGGRVLSLGAENVVSYIVRGSVRRAGYYLSAGNFFGLIALMFYVASSFLQGSSEVLLLSVSFSFILAGTAFYTGALRSHSNAFQEIRSNLPWFFVCICMLVFGGETAVDIFRYLVGSYVVVNLLDFFVLRRLGIDWGVPRVRVVWHHVKDWRRWVPVSLSAIGVAASLRSFPIVMGWVGIPVTDSVAYNFLIGEIVYQVCMVYVNQIHSRISRERVDLSLGYSIRVLGAFVVGSFVSVFGVYLFSLILDSAIFKGLEYKLLLAVSLYCAAVAAFSFVRIFAWKDRRLLAPVLVLVVQGVSFVLCGMLVLLMGMSWVVVLVGAALLILLIYAPLFYLTLSRGR